MRLPMPAKPLTWWYRVPEGFRPYLADTGVALLVLAVNYAPFVIPRPEQPGPFAAAAWLWMGGASLPLVLRRKFPISCLLAIFVSLNFYNALSEGAVSEPIAWGMLVAIYSVAWRGRLWQQTIVMAMLLLGSLFGLKSGTTAVIGTLTSTGAFVLGWVARRREEHLQELAFRAGQLEREREADAARAVATERARIARDMHDVLAHAVSLMVVQAEAGPVVVRTKPERAERAFEAIAAAGRDAMVQLRRTLGILKDEQDTGVRTPQPTVAGIADLVVQVSETGLTATYEITGSALPLTPDAEVAAFRIVQEALTNTIKHAAATTVAVALDWGRNALMITVRDDGAGTGTMGGSGNGLIGIRERAASCGGTAVSGPLPGGGFEVTATLPAVTR